MFISVNTEGSLKVKQHDVFTRPENNEPKDEVDVVGCGHVTIEEVFDHETFEEDAEVTPLSLEDGVQSTIDELKEVNIGTIEEPCPTFISTQISDDDENEYVNLFKADKDVFTWSYKEMPGLDLKVPHTCQRATQRICDDMLHKHVECYVDDLLVKSKKKCDHLKDLKLVLDRLKKYQLRMNPLKCAFDVTSGKFLGFIMRHQGIEGDHSKIDAIQKMPSPKNLHELKRLQGCLAYIRSIKKYLLNPQVLSAPAVGKPLTLYIAVQEASLGAILAQENDKDKECALYYLSRTLTGAWNLGPCSLMVRHEEVELVLA
ncbi:uncharacterized protein E5676_scaffold1161G00100 [Cucumis melo var. makuwa]|uniref:Reverse transcriptase domain-containing protein n=1 Tax=Cucumis melo var. makuwa TaxID=1194695 RepID=A0A5A7UBU5_CUCMM|nr:uncharacterized protein E6C27_scaffold511G00370 [Cucumis melo var. makuwa]TYK02684.1 uncharacterized protein E5676_scaffold1161G00100 [Cucumis melo var. makuwa]